MVVTGVDRDGHNVPLPETLDEYYRGAAKRFATIRSMTIRYRTASAEEKLLLRGGVVEGDFSLLRAFVADHDRALHVVIEEEDQSIEDPFRLRLFFPAYLYGFVEDTFARAIHHKIEGPGFACRECVGKRELRLREYDGLFRHVKDDDVEAGIFMALYRLTTPAAISPAHESAYAQYLKAHDKDTLLLFASGPGGMEDYLEYMIRRELLSEEAIKYALPYFDENRHAKLVALLLGRPNKKRKKRRLCLE